MASVDNKVTAATAGGTAVGLAIALVEWLAVVDVPEAVEIPAVALGIFLSGWFVRSNRGKGDHVATD